MAYHVFRVYASRRLEHIGEFDAYRDARVFARDRRKELDAGGDCTVRMIFAPGKEQAERLLRETREARPLGEDA